MEEAVKAANALEVYNDESYAFALEIAKQCKDRSRRVQEMWKDAREHAHKAWQSITKTIASFVDPLEEAATICGRKAYAWKQEQERLAQEAERARQEQERRRIEDERLAQAERLQAEGHVQAANAVLNKEIEVAPKAVEKKTPKVAGVTYRENWVCVVEDASLVPREYLTPDLTKIIKVVKALKGETRIPGVKAWDAGSTVIAKK
jgi:hypothetical protein